MKISTIARRAAVTERTVRAVALDLNIPVAFDFGIRSWVIDEPVAGQLIEHLQELRPLKGTKQMTTLTESTEKAYCAECGKHWNAAVVDDGICFMCQDDLEEA